MSATSELARLLEHPAIWRGTSVARTEVLPTGFAALDQRLPGGGWPRSGLIEILISRFGVGELTLMLPALAALTRLPTARWSVWVAPPLEPFAPALTAHGVVLERLLVVRAPAGPEIARRGMRGGPDARGTRDPRETSDARGTRDPRGARNMRDGARRTRDTGILWAFEQSLGSGACDLVMAWSGRPRPRQIRRLQLSAERGRSLGVLFRPYQAAQEASHAALRMVVEPCAYGVRLTLLKSRGGVRGSVELELQSAGS